MTKVNEIDGPVGHLGGGGGGMESTYAHPIHK